MLIIVGNNLSDPNSQFGFLQIDDDKLSEVSQLANIPLFDFNKRDHCKEYTLELFNQYLCDGYGRILDRLKDPALVATDRSELVKVLADMSGVMAALEPYSEREDQQLAEVLILRDPLVMKISAACFQEIGKG